MQKHIGFALMGGLFAFVAVAISGCPPSGPACGNGTCEAGEDSTSCAADCTGTCGNGVCDAGETTATCAADCTTPLDCGNGMLDAGEDCEGGALGGATCASLGHNGGGALGCNADCTYDETACLDLLPDEMVLAAALDGTAPNSDFFITEGYDLRPCEVAQCGSLGTTNRRILEFTLVSENVGTATLHFGDPQNILPPYTGLWEYAGPACGYYQFTDYADYWICPSSVADCAAATGTDRAAEGGKGSFCFIENYGDAPDWSGPNASCGMYSCSDMGQQPGCADDYYTGLDCQWIDITGVAPGAYTICAWIDPTNRIVELDDDNNISCRPVTIN
jgi:hypothetical protein